MKPKTLKKLRRALRFCLPLLIALDLVWLTAVFQLLRTASDMAVLGGVILLCLFGWVNYLIYRFI